MKFGDWIEKTDASGLYFVVYTEEDDNPIWTGHYSDIPYWVGKRELGAVDEELDVYPVSYRGDLGFEFDHKPGLVITVKN